MKQYNEGTKAYDLAKLLFPITRSITGEGVRKTLGILNQYIADNAGGNLSVFSVPTGTKVFDWTIPEEWIIREAYIEDERGNKIIDIKDNNLHVLGYSEAVDRWVDLDTLNKYVYTLSEQPEVIPYVTSYYKRRYGFCMSERQRQSLEEGKYHMVIDSELIDGVLNYAEIIIPGESDKEVFLSTYICHPSMANNECSGPALMAELICYLCKMPQRRYTYRIAFVPETIGAITYLCENERWKKMKESVVAGFNITCVGDNRDYSMVDSRNENTLADRALRMVLEQHTGGKYSEYSFLERGSDERQYNAPGIDLPVVCFCRTKFEKYPEYHTSADDMKIISPEGFQGAYDVMKKTIELLEKNNYYCTKVLCEPQLGKRGLMPTISKKNTHSGLVTMKNIIAYADGKRDLISLCEKIGCSIEDSIHTVDELEKAGVIEICKRN